MVIAKEEKPKRAPIRRPVASRVRKEPAVRPKPVKIENPEEVAASESKEIPAASLPRYFEAVGRRKTAVAQIRLFTRGEKGFMVNDKQLEAYFPGKELPQIANSPIDKMHCEEKFLVVAKVRGGGIHSQAEAIRHGISRALILFNQEFRKRLKRAGYLTRDARMRERKKFGLKRARRAPQFSKR